MKYTFFVLFIILIGTAFPQSKSDKVKDRLVELFDLCNSDNYSDAASYIVYRGSDKERKWKDFYDKNNETEMKEVKQVCIGIKFDLVNGGDYEFVGFKTEKESEGEWCIWEVHFGTGEKMKKTYFAFLKIKGKYCLGDID